MCYSSINTVTLMRVRNAIIVEIVKIQDTTRVISSTWVLFSNAIILVKIKNDRAYDLGIASTLSLAHDDTNTN